MSDRSLTGAELAQLSAPAPRPLLHPETMVLQKFSTSCDKSAEWKCIDVDECWANASSPMLGETPRNSSATNFTASPRSVCPENSVCTNAWSSYTCSCLSGFFMANGSCQYPQFPSVHTVSADSAAWVSRVAKSCANPCMVCVLSVRAGVECSSNRTSLFGSTEATDCK